MKITGLKTFILHVPVTREGIRDSVHSLTHWGVPGVIVETDEGITGYGYGGTHADIVSDRQLIRHAEEALAPLLIGEDPTETRYLWNRLLRHPPLQWVGRGGITQLAVGMVDIALWDIKAKAQGLPLWKLLGGSRTKRVAAYNTDGGWLNWSLEMLLEDAARSVEERGFRGVKMKIGSDLPERDVRRVEAVRKTVGSDIKLMVDANGRWDLPTAQRFVVAARDLDLFWFEEPIWYDDIIGHQRLAAISPVPIALGEQLYVADHFRQFIAADAVHYLQPDVTRLSGITEWWQVAEMCEAARLPVCAHAGDMGQVHVHLSIAHSSSTMLEYIPWIRECFEDPLTIDADGFVKIPEQPGAGSTLREDAIARFGVT